VLGLGIPIARAQSSVTVKVETYHGALISGARVVANRLHLPKKASEKPVVLEALDVPEKKRGTYTADRLVNGDYELFACDDGLNYEPQVTETFRLGDESKKVPTLVLRDEPQVEDPPFPRMAQGTKVCVIHKATGCKVTKTIDVNGNITIRGIWDDYGFEPRACKQDR